MNYDDIRREDANYRDVALPDYAGNPLIEALPGILSAEESMTKLGHPIKYSKAERELPPHLRQHCVKRLENLVVALPLHVRFESEISILLRGGYVSRNPTLSQTWQAMMANATTRSESPTPMPEHYRSSAASMLLTGLSGIGKSTMLEIILNTYPQVIHHTEYKGTKFQHTQIVWLKIDCPHDGSLKGLCREFFKAVDRATGTTDYERQWRGTRHLVEDMQAAMETIASTFFLGLLVIDELQHLSIAKAGGSEKMMNFYVNLINKIGVPIVLTGTYKVKEIFATQMRQARRASDKGTIDFGRYEKNDPVWSMLVKSVWKYQWVKNPVKLDELLMERIYDLTQGVTALLVNLLAMAQSMAIAEELDTVNANVLQQVYDNRMQILHPAINALRSGNVKKMAQFDDLLPTSFAIVPDVASGLPDDAEILARLMKKAEDEPDTDAKPENVEAPAVVIPADVLAGDIRNKSGQASDEGLAHLDKLGVLSKDPMALPSE